MVTQIDSELYRVSDPVLDTGDTPETTGDQALPSRSLYSSVMPRGSSVPLRSAFP